MRSIIFLVFLSLFESAFANKNCDICGCEDPNACEVGDDARGRSFDLPDGSEFKSGCKELQRIANQGTTVFSDDYCTNQLPYQARPICKCFIIATLEDLPEVFDPNDRYGNLTSSNNGGSGDDDDDDDNGSGPTNQPPSLGPGSLPCPINEPNCNRQEAGGDTSGSVKAIPGMIGALSVFLGLCTLW